MKLSHYLTFASVLLPIWTISYWVLPYFTIYQVLKQYPGPFICKFSNSGLHLAPVMGVPGVFNIRDCREHTKKRKIISHAFSPAAVNGVEAHITANLERWVGQLDKIAARSGSHGFARMNRMLWCTFITFDIIGDLAFDAPFGMVINGRDECESACPDHQCPIFLPLDRNKDPFAFVYSKFNIVPGRTTRTKLPAQDHRDISCQDSRIEELRPTNLGAADKARIRGLSISEA
ncbi:hypothetical protein EDB80DRAFT_872615 [Ilyonectria destructans]|nr:hypothetical protein EDB80DRAFT_872615 [Ilyonectria destructans]